MVSVKWIYSIPIRDSAILEKDWSRPAGQYEEVEWADR